MVASMLTVGAASAARGLPVIDPFVPTTARIERGGVELAGSAGAPTRRQSTGCIAIDRGVAVEEHCACAEGVEQSWRFAQQPPGRGPLRIHLRVGDGVRAARRLPNGLELLGEASRPRVRYADAAWVDADGVRTPMEMGFVAGEIVLSVPEAVLDSSAYPAVLDPTVSAEFAVDDPVYVGAMGISPSVASDGTSYFVVWYRSTDVYGARVGADGTVLDIAGLPISRAAGEQSGPRIAWDGANYLVVWQDSRAWASTDIYAARVTALGEVLDTDGILVSAASGDEMTPAVAFDGTNYLVVWRNPAAPTPGVTVYGARVSTDGTVLDSAAVPVMAGWTVDVAYGAGTYLVVSGDEAARVGLDGSVLGPTVVYKTGWASADPPRVAFDGASFLIVWSADLMIDGARVSPDGTLLDPAPRAFSRWYSTGPSVAFNGSDYWVVWQDCRGCWSYVDLPYDVYGTRVTPAGAPRDYPGIAISSVYDYEYAPTLACSSSSCLAVWYATGAGSAFAGRLDAAGGVLDPTRIQVTRAANPENGVVAAFDPSLGEYFLAWEDSRASASVPDVYGARVDTRGTVLDRSGVRIASSTTGLPSVGAGAGSFLAAWTTYALQDIYAARIDGSSGALVDPSSIAVSTTPAGSQIESAVGFDGTNYLVVWRNVDHLYGARVSTAGILLDRTAFAISTASGQQRLPAVGFDGTNFLVAWTDSRNLATTSEDIYAARVTLAGVVLDPLGIPIRSIAGRERSPAVAFDGTNALVVWAEVPSSLIGGDIYAARVANDGTVLDPGGVPVSTAPGVQRTPAAAWDGTDFIVAWCDFRAGPQGDVYATRVSTAGVVLDPGGFAVAAEPQDAEVDPSAASDGAGNVLVSYSRFDPSPVFGSTRARFRFVVGLGCSSASECTTGYCVDGVCCDDPCGGGDANDCLACSTAAGALRNGTCAVLPLATLCRPSAGPCDPPEYCNGADATCQGDILTVRGAPCRPAVGPCDIVETCDGFAASCPPDALVPFGTPCRPVAGLCDVEEFCDGGAPSCPSDAFAPAGTPCRPAADLCDVEEVCGGGAPSCPPDAFASMGMPCRPAAGPCDVEEACDGTSLLCPPDQLATGLECRSSAGPCDLPELCDGADPACPPDAPVVDCDDRDPCTDDLCDGIGGCRHVAVTAPPCVAEEGSQESSEAAPETQDAGADDAGDVESDRRARSGCACQAAVQRGRDLRAGWLLGLLVLFCLGIRARGRNHGRVRDLSG